jgi:hypothetical protein
MSSFKLESLKSGDSLSLTSTMMYPGVTDLHVHKHANGLTLTMVYKGNKEHLDLDRYMPAAEFKETVDYMYTKLQQKYG